MDENKVIDLTEATQKKQPWYKRAWNKIKEVASNVWDWSLDHAGIVIGAMAAICAYLWGWLFGWMAGLDEGEKNGKNKGYREGYIDCTQDLKESGYKVYGGYGEDAGELIVKKIVESHEEEIEHD